MVNGGQPKDKLDYCRPLYLSNIDVKRALDKCNIIPQFFSFFFQKNEIFLSKEVLIWLHDYILVQLNFWEIVIFVAISIFEINFNKYTIQWPMGHCDDAVHKKSNKMKMHWPNWLKFLVLAYFKVLFRTRYNEIDVILVQFPLNAYGPTSSLLVYKCVNKNNGQDNR